jgi:hypothetical protein
VFHTTQLANDPRRYITDLSTILNSNGKTTLELDLHAATCVLDRDVLIFLDYDRPVVDEGYDPALGTKTYATISRGLAYDDPQTFKVYDLVINQAIHIPHFDHHLLCPMQCWVNDMIANDTPNFLTPDHFLFSLQSFINLCTTKLPIGAIYLWEVIAKDTHRGRLLLGISPPYCIIPTVMFTL